MFFCASKTSRSENRATLIKLEQRNSEPADVIVWRGLASTYVLFYCQRQNGEVIIADHFRNLLSLLPLEERDTSDEMVIDHCLFRTNPGLGSYCRNVSRIGHGERWQLNLSTGEINRTLPHRIPSASNPRGIDTCIEDIDAALTTAIDDLNLTSDTSTLFSGGGVSTLVQSYLDPSVPSVYVTRDGRGLAYERTMRRVPPKTWTSY